MPDYVISFDEVQDRDTMALPNALLARGGRYQVQVHGGDVFIAGNREGLLYLAEVLGRCALGGYARGFHVHLPMAAAGLETPMADGTTPELVFFGASDEPL